MDLAFTYTALPCAVLPFTAQKPVMLSSLRACLTASHHFFIAELAHRFFACADRALLTTLPDWFFISRSFVKPPCVFCLLPRKTSALASLPRAMMLVRFAFMAIFMALPFIATFMAALMALLWAGSITTTRK